jgi:arylsulfatase A-like enzyme
LPTGPPPFIIRAKTKCDSASVLVSAWVNFADMKSVFFLTLLAAYTLLQAAPPNVLFIVADDLNAGFATYGHPQVKTPHLDRLAKMGVRFDRAYCSYPVCNASRTSFLSGRHPRSTGVVGNGVDPRALLGADFKFLPEHFKERGYFTAGIGKITHTPEFLKSIRWDVVTDPQHDPELFEEVNARVLRTRPDEQHPDGITARLASRLMEEHRGGPFFIGAGFHRPHLPLIAPQKYFDLYPPDQITVPTGTTPPDLPEIARPPFYDAHLPPEEARARIHAYHACVTFMDAQLGVLMEAMDRLALWDSTVVVFLSDNGYHLGEHGGFWGKMSLMDQSSRVPLIIHAPGMTAGACAAPVSLVDVFPTITELCGQPQPQGLEGRSLVPLLRDPSASWEHPACSVVVRGEKREGRLDLGRSAHTGRQTFIQWPDGSRQLYDDLADPAQTHNLATDPAQTALITTLQAALLPESSIPAIRGIGHSEGADEKKARREKKKKEIETRATTPQASTSATKRPPNVIVILADDLGYHDLSIHGCTDIPTPHIDSLAKNGVRCTDAYITAPVCSPSRAGLLTGRYQNRFGFEFLVSPDAVTATGEKAGLDPREKTIANHFQALGHTTGCIGKWHLGDTSAHLPMQRGFDVFYGSPGQSNYFTPTLIDSAQSSKPTKVTSPGYYLTDDYASRAAAFVEQHAAKPFFLYLPHFAAHTPYQADEARLAKFSSITDPKRRTFAAMVSALDDAVGTLLAALRKSGLEENTLLFFLSDNGGTGGVGDNRPLRGGKGSTWEGGIRTPFLVQWKGTLPAGLVYREPISSLDILPTALAAVGAKVDAQWQLDGVNLLPHFQGTNTELPHAHLFWRFGTQRAIRSGAWKLVQAREERGGSIQIAKAGPWRLYNLRQDPAEQNDLIAKQPDKARKLTQLWEKWNTQLPTTAWQPTKEE